MSDRSVPLSWTRSPWTCWIEITGPSHVRFIQGLCSNNVVELAAGHGCEAYVPTVQGKVLGHGYFWKSADRLDFAGLGDQAAALLSHLRKYAMIEDVEVVDRSDAGEAIFVWGSGVETFLHETFGEPVPGGLEHRAAMCDGSPVHLLRYPSFEVDSVEVRGEGASQVAARLSEMGAAEVDASQFEAVRIASRFPKHGVDITAEHLAQEVNRDDSAISFKKGCYLGQETVARIDAMGHVNKKLVAITLDRGVSSLPLTIEVDGKEIGQVTSAAEFAGQSVGLAMIRRGHNGSGTKISAPLGTIEVR